MSCCEPPAPEGASGAVIGRLQFAGDGLCKDQRPISFKSGQCCIPGTPTDERFTAAAPGLDPLLAEVDALVQYDTRCCNIPDPFASKPELDAKWLPKVNEHLAKHGLVAQLYVGRFAVAKAMHLNNGVIHERQAP